MSKIINTLVLISSIITMCGIGVVTWKSIGMIASQIEASSLERRNENLEEYNREVFRGVIFGERQDPNG